MGITNLTLFAVLLAIRPTPLPVTPDDPGAHYSRADALAAKGDLDAAMGEYQQARCL
jgi:hypothetical protein